MTLEYIIFTLASVGAFVMGILMIFLRQKEAKKPLNYKKIIIPPIMMSTGALMFVFPYFRISGLEILESVGVGLLFSLILIFTTKYESHGNQLFVKPSKFFAAILFGLLVLRIVIKSILSIQFEPGTLAGMFFVLALTMIIIWRISMFIRLHQFNQKHALT